MNVVNASRNLTSWRQAARWSIQLPVINVCTGAQRVLT
jgi:hypothetical protein